MWSNQNNQQQYQQYADQWDQGTMEQMPAQQVHGDYQQFVQNAPPQAFQQAHEQYYQQMPPQQRGGLMQELMGGLAQRGVMPQQMGLPQDVNPQQMSPQQAAQVTGYTQQQQPDLLHQVMGPGGPLGSTGAKLAAAGVLALAAKQFLGSDGGGFKL